MTIEQRQAYAAAFRKVMQLEQSRTDNGLPYAKAYAGKGLEGVTVWPADMLATQALYVLCNLQHCRAANVSEARQALRSLPK